MARWADHDNGGGGDDGNNNHDDEVHKCGQVCLFIKVGQVASNWETPSGFKLGDPKGFIQSDLLDQKVERNNKTHCFAFSISFLQPKSKITHHEMKLT